MRFSDAVEVARTDWWRSLTPEQQRRYLKRHPSSQFHPGGGRQGAHKGNPPKTPDRKPKKPVATGPVKFPKSRIPKTEETKQKAEDAKKNWSVNDQVKQADEALSKIDTWNRGKISRAATAIRTAIGSKEGKALLKATAKVMAIAGAGLIVGGAALAIGDTSVFLPSIAEKVWEKLQDYKEDRELVKNFTEKLREKLANPTPEEIEDALIKGKS